MCLVFSLFLISVTYREESYACFFHGCHDDQMSDWLELDHGGIQILALGLYNQLFEGRFEDEIGINGIWMYKHLRTSILTATHAHKRTHAYTCTHARTQTHTHSQAHTHTHTHTHTPTFGYKTVYGFILVIIHQMFVCNRHVNISGFFMRITELRHCFML